MLLLGLLTVASCSKGTRTNTHYSTPPSLTVEAGAEYEFKTQKVQVFSIIPKGKPSCEFALKVVQNGKVDKIQSYTFEEISQKGSLAVCTWDKGIDLTFDLKSQGSESTRREVVIPDDSRRAGLSTQCELSDASGIEDEFWQQAYLIGDAPSSYGMAGGNLEDIIENSKEYPGLRSYLLTLKLKQKP